VRVGAEQPDEREDLGVYAQLPEVSVADIGEQPLVVSLGNCLQGRLQLLQSFLVADFQDAEHLVDAEPVTAGVGIRLVVGQDRDKAICLASLWRQDDAAPETVHPDRADAIVAAVVELLQVQAGVRVFGELADGRLDRALYAFLEFCVFRKEAFRDRQACQCPPPLGRSLPVCPFY
jgi:hypothetical protein